MRRAWLAIIVLAGCAFLAVSFERGVLAAQGAKVELKTDNTEPRDVEDATRAAIVRDYGAAWQNLAVAMDQNRPDLLDVSFVGVARDKLAQGITEQRKAGLHRRYVDRGHHLQAVFYSYDGSAMQLTDTAQVEIQLMDGGQVVAQEPATIHYVVLMTPAENSWKVRDMMAVPAS